MPELLDYGRPDDVRSSEAGVVRATAMTIGLSLLPLGLWLVVDWVSDIDAEPASTVTMWVSVAIWFLAVASGCVGIGRCLARRRHCAGTERMGCNVLMIFNAMPVALAAFLAAMFWYHPF